jgi:hypothetical protein
VQQQSSHPCASEKENINFVKPISSVTDTVGQITRLSATSGPSALPTRSELSSTWFCLFVVDGRVSALFVIYHNDGFENYWLQLMEYQCIKH